MRRLLKWLGIGLAVVLVGGIVGIWFFGGSLLRTGVEKGSRYALGVPVTVGGGTLNVLGGSVGISKMIVPNPEGYSATNALAFESLSVGVQVGSLLSDTIVVHELNIEAPEIRVESTTDGTNLGALLDHAQKITSGKKKPADAPAGGEKPMKKVRIGRIHIANAKVHVTQKIAGGFSPSVSIPIPEVELKDLGTDPKTDGITMSELFAKIVGAIEDAIAKRSDLLPAEIANQLSKEASTVADSLGKEIGKALGDVGKDVGKEVQKAGDELQKSLEGVFGKKK